MFVTITDNKNQHTETFEKRTDLFEHLTSHFCEESPEKIISLSYHNEIRNINEWLDSASIGDEYDGDGFTLTYGNQKQMVTPYITPPTYRIGEMKITTKEITIEKAISADTVVIPKGTQIIIGADRMAHHLYTGYIQPLQKDAIVKDYDVHGLAELIYLKLKDRFQIDTLLEMYDDSDANFKEIIANALEDIGF